MEEDTEREQRANNLILVNVKESNNEDIKAAKQEDLTNVKQILGQIVDIQDGDITDPIRLGAKNGGRSRYLKIKVEDLEKKKEILRNAYKINKRDTPREAKIYINNHMKAERDEDKKLRDRLKELNAKTVETGEE